MAANARSPVVICKGVILVLGFVILVLGCVSHFESTWNKIDSDAGYNTIKLYKVCDLPLNLKNCPSIGLERYFVAMIFISFILSVCSIVATFFLDMGSSTMKYIDMILHGVLAILLLIAAIVYFVSAEQIRKLLPQVLGIEIPNKGPGYNFRRPEKLAAATLTLFQTVLYAVTAFLIAKN